MCFKYQKIQIDYSGLVLILLRFDRVGFPLFYGSGSKTGSTRGVFDRNSNRFKFKRYKK
jgi:hypothetical protein